MSKNLAVIILAAGKGSRMESNIPKVLHKVAHKPMIKHVIDTAESLNPKKIICVIGPDTPEVEQSVKPHSIVMQEERLGTGHALQCALPQLKDFKGDVMVLYGDTPLVTPDTLERLYARHKGDNNPGVTVLGMVPPDPRGYGRLIMNEDRTLAHIVEEKDASDLERTVNSCNSGIYCFDGRDLHAWADDLSNSNAQKEYYITDIPAIAKKDGRITAVEMGNYAELMGVNTRPQLAQVEAVFQSRRRIQMMESGVTLIDPTTVYFAADTVIGKDSIIEPNVYFGEGIRISENVCIKANSYLEQCEIASGCKIGPFARIRPKSVLDEGVEVGNFVEVNRSHLGKGSKAKHLTYIGDTETGDTVNIGAGTITCNYDGTNKHKTQISSGAFIGSNTTLVAPVKIGESAYIGAGSTITKDVEADSLGLGRSKQMNKAEWAKKRSAAKKSD